MVISITAGTLQIKVWSNSVFFIPFFWTASKLKMKRKLKEPVRPAPAKIIKTNEENVQATEPDKNNEIEEEYDPESVPTEEASSSTDTSKKKKRYSLVWNHFSIEVTNEKNEIAGCNYCAK